MTPLYHAYTTSPGFQPSLTAHHILEVGKGQKVLAHYTGSYVDWSLDVIAMVNIPGTVGLLSNSLRTDTNTIINSDNMNQMGLLSSLATKQGVM